MIFNDLINDEINSIYYNLREKAEYYPNKIKKLLNKSKEYVSYENDIARLKLSKSNALYLNQNEIISEIDNKIKEVNDKRIKYLKQFDLDDNKLIPKYSCELCNDTGLINSKYCKCYYLLYNKLVSNKLGINNNFNLDNYKDIKGLEQHYNLFNQYIEKFPNINISNFIFDGKTGTGKSYLANYIVYKLNLKGFSTLFITAIQLNTLLLKIHTNQDDKESILNILTQSDLLVIDDLGTEPIYKNVTKEYLNYIISSRLSENKAFIITTNLTSNEILEKYEDRIFSRLMDKDKIKKITFSIDDLRLNKG